MMSCPRPPSWLHQFLQAGAWPKRRRLTTFLRLEELERRITPSVTVVPQQFATNEYTALNITQSQLLAGDSDSSGAALTLTNPTQPANATLVDNHNGTFTFTPNNGFTGSTTFQYTVNANTQPQLAGPENSANAGFGNSISIDGDTAIVGAREQTVNGLSNAGAAYVFVLSGTTWVQQAVLTAADAAANDYFGYSVSISGDTAVIGTSEVAPSPGAAYVFVRSGSTWSQQAELTPSDGFAGETFGASVAISGDTIVVGQRSSQPGMQPSEAYVFVRSGSTWSQQAILSGGINNGFGGIVSISGDTAVISGGLSQAAVYVYVGSGGTWAQQAELTLPTEEPAFSLAVDGDTAILGSLNGAAYVFVRSGTTWSQQATLTPEPNGGGEFGYSVAISGDTAVVGADLYGESGTGFSGAAYIFQRAGDTWTQQAQLIGPFASGSGDQFGQSVAISGNTAAIGALGGAFVENLDTATATATVQVNPAAAQLIVSPATLPNGVEGQAYPGPTFSATGGAGSGYTFQESGILPPGLTFDSATGQPTGTPTQIGTYPGIIIAASDGHGGSGSQTYTLVVSHYGVNGFPIPYPPTIYAPPTSMSDPNADLDAYFSSLYNSILDRNPETGSTSLPFWENVYNLVQTGTQADPLHLNVPAGTGAYQYVADGIWDSYEHRRNEVGTYYQDFLGRTLDLSNSFDANGLTYWINQFMNGATEEQVIRGFLSSAEYLYDHRNDASLADALNTSLLGGNATAADLQTWNADLSPLDAQRASIQNQTFTSPVDYQSQLSAANLALLGNDTATTGVLVDMLSSSEYQQAALNSFYQAFLRRAGTPAEEQAFLSQKDANGNPLSLGAIAEMLLASPEYRTNAVNSEV